MLYVSSGDIWRSAGCFSPDQTISDLAGGAFFRARFCSREHVLRCSKMSHILEASSMGSPWRMALIVPAAVLIFLVVLICVLLVFCCRTRSPVKKERKVSKNFCTMPQSETKNTVVHGSQADSGVFTLDSNKLKSAIPAHNYSSDETAAENWTDENCDGSSDHYHNESAKHNFFQGAMGGDRNHENSCSGTEDESTTSGRVIREIIV
ncbi:unnamed protein product [Heligmosomoides polygyrus]|uniref:DUF7652 domain-containing protein n=1 Tax=Heligmosomoides polygyrus TaxID=6339 RepID=A0A3P8BNL5_HELPZ|nr:unnamed protein product [Heligmosomoides polygyrus]